MTVDDWNTDGDAKYLPTAEEQVAMDRSWVVVNNPASIEMKSSEWHTTPLRNLLYLVQIVAYVSLTLFGVLLSGWAMWGWFK